MDISKKEKSYFNVAKAVSELSTFKKIHIGCVIVCNRKIISSGFNNMKTHPMQKELNKERFPEDTFHCMHAELDALVPILDKDINWKKTEIYLYRQYKDGNMALSKPCKSCMRLIRSLGIKKIHYTGCSSYVYEEIY